MQFKISYRLNKKGLSLKVDTQLANSTQTNIRTTQYESIAIHQAIQTQEHTIFQFNVQEMYKLAEMSKFPKRTFIINGALK